MGMKAMVVTILMMWLGSPEGAVASATDMSIDKATDATRPLYELVSQSDRSKSPNVVRVEQDVILRLDVRKSMKREEKSPSGRKRRTAVRSRQLLWPNAVVPYELRALFSTREVKELKNAMADYEKYTCVRFREKNANDSDFVPFVGSYGCSSQVGRQLGVQMLSLTPVCRRKPMIIRSLGHTIGLIYEHARPDRDDYIVINQTNLSPLYAAGFVKYTSEKMDVGGIPYDYLSIMHYDEYAGSNGNIVITTKDPKYQKVIGRQQGLSFRDAKRISMMYGCIEQNGCSRKFCPGEGFVGQDCQCWCPTTKNLTAAEHCHPFPSSAILAPNVAAFNESYSATIGCVSSNLVANVSLTVSIPNGTTIESRGMASSSLVLPFPSVDWHSAIATCSVTNPNIPNMIVATRVMINHIGSAVVGDIIIYTNESDVTVNCSTHAASYPDVLYSWRTPPGANVTFSSDLSNTSFRVLQGQLGLFNCTATNIITMENVTMIFIVRRMFSQTRGPLHTDLVIGLVLGIITVVTLAVVLVFLWKRGHFSKGNKERVTYSNTEKRSTKGKSPGTQPSEERVYAITYAPSIDRIYESLNAQPASEPTYAQLTEAHRLNDKAAYENF